LESRVIINQLISVTAQLSTLLEKETAYLRQRNLAEIREMQQEKAGLGSVYEKLMKELLKDPHLLAGIEPILRVELIAKTELMDAQARANETQLRIAREINEKVIRAIADAASATKKRTGAYSQNGKINRGTNKQAVSMSINETL